MLLLPEPGAAVPARRARGAAPPPAPAAPAVVLVASGRHGAGTSTLAALLSLAASTTHERVLLLDAEEALPPLAGDHDLVVIDAGARLATIERACTAGVTRAILVATPDRVAVASSYALLKVLATRFRIPHLDVLVKQAEESSAEQVHAEIQGAARLFLHTEVGLCGWVPDDHCLRAGLQAGMGLPEAAAGSPAAAAIRQVSSALTSPLIPAGAANADRRPHWRL
jgi:MinD-like ATPase involved in chromosome partitioning or flagellar assembly